MPWPEPVERVAAYLRSAGAEARIEELLEEGATAQGAADAVGSTLSQIVKSIVLVCDGSPVLVLVGGDRRVDTRAVARTCDTRHARFARAEEVLAATGFEPGGVTPFPLAHVDRVLLDRPLLGPPVVWCGAGSPRHLVALAPLELQRLSRGDVADVSALPGESGSDRKV